MTLVHPSLMPQIVSVWPGVFLQPSSQGDSGLPGLLGAGLRGTQAPSGQMSALGVEDVSPLEMMEQ